MVRLSRSSRKSTSSTSPPRPTIAFKSRRNTMKRHSRKCVITTARTKNTRKKFRHCVITTATSTPTPYPTEEPGCCDSDNIKKFDMRAAKETKDKCERSSSCNWNKGDDAIYDSPSTNAADNKKGMDTRTEKQCQCDCLINDDCLINEDGSVHNCKCK